MFTNTGTLVCLFLGMLFVALYGGFMIGRAFEIAKIKLNTTRFFILDEETNRFQLISGKTAEELAKNAADWSKRWGVADYLFLYRILPFGAYSVRDNVIKRTA